MLDALAIIIAVLVVVVLGGAVLWVAYPPARPALLVAVRVLVYVIALAGVVLAVMVMGRRRPRPTTPAPPRDGRPDVMRADARAERADSRAEVAGAVADPDPDTGWATLLAEERRLRAQIYGEGQ